MDVPALELRAVDRLRSDFDTRAAVVPLDGHESVFWGITENHSSPSAGSSFSGAKRTSKPYSAEARLRVRQVDFFIHVPDVFTRSERLPSQKDHAFENKVCIPVFKII